MRPIIRGPWPIDPTTEENVEYKNYANARAKLIERMGQFCSYCEMKQTSSLAVEHIQPKKPPGAENNIPERELNWDNLLLGCTNCNSTKGNEDVELDDYLWPDRDNTFKALSYSEGGLIHPNASLGPSITTKAQKTITLTGLDKQPANNPAVPDRRWENRRETWDIAQRNKERLSRNFENADIREIIIDAATGHGYWSVWMTVFKDDPDMLSRFIDAYPGTCGQCFDDNNGQALLRPGGQI